MKVPVFLALTTVSSLAFAADSKPGEKITFDDHIYPILENKCVNCHNPDESKGGLDLSSYGAVLTGGSGGKIVEPENPSGSRLYSLMAHTEEPFMPPEKPKAPDAELEVIAKWINGGILETSSSKAKKSDKPKLDMSLITSAGKPEGPAAMPEGVLIQPEVLTERPNAGPAIAHSPWAPIVAVAGQKQVILYHSEDFDVLGILPYPEGFPQSLSFSSNGSLIQAGGGRGGKSGGVVAWDVKTGERVFEVGREFDIVLGSDISPDHRHVVLGGPGKIFKIWDTISGEQIHAIKKHPDWLLTADYSPDGVLLATGGRNNGLFIWEGGSALEFYTLKGHTKAITDLAWRPDSNILASISEDGQLILWEMQEGKEFKKWNAHPGGGLAVDFSADGQLIASAGRDKQVKVWDLNGKAVRTIAASDDIVMSVAFSHDNKRVISGDFNGDIKVWDVSNGRELTSLLANPPTIDKQIEYAEKRITDLNSKIPQLEKSVAAVAAEAQRARTKLSEVAKTATQLTQDKAAKDKEFAGLDAKLKALKAQRDSSQKDVAAKTATLQQRQKERAAAEQQLTAAKKAEADAKNLVTTSTGERDKLVQSVAAMKKTASSPVFDDAAKQQAYLKAKELVVSLQKTRQAAEGVVAAKTAESQKLNGQLNQAKSALDAAKKAEASFVAGVQKSDATVKAAEKAWQSADAQWQAATPEEKADGTPLTTARNQASTRLNQARQALTDANNALARSRGTLDGAQKNFTQIQGVAGKANADLANARKKLDEQVGAYNQAVAAVKNYEQQGAKRIQAIAAARKNLPAEEGKLKQAEATLKQRTDALNQKTALITSTTAKLNTAKSAEGSAAAALEASKKVDADRAGQYAQVAKVWNESKAKVAQVTKELDTATKQKEAQTKAVQAIASKESQTKQGIEIAKADLEQNKFLAQRYKAEAINFKAAIESDELDDMNTELDDMLVVESEAKEKFKEAAKAREEAEKTLADAKKTVEVGTKKLKETTASVLDRALALIAKRASAEIREEMAETEADTLVAAAAEGNDDLVAVELPEKVLPEEAKEEVEVVEVVSTLIGNSPEEINAEIAAIEKRIAQLTDSIASAYSEADKTVSTVKEASTVAAKTPAVIAERSEIEKAKAEEAKKKEEQRKAQEDLLHRQKQLIAELKKKYLDTLPERK